MNVDPGVNVLSQPNHPARLLALFAASLAVTGVIAGAAIAMLYVVDDLRGGNDAPSAASAPQHIEAPEGLVVVIPVADAKEFKALTGFKPFVPSSLPETTRGAPVMSVTQPDEEGRRVGRVSYSAKPDPVEGVTGPLIVIIEAKGTPGDGVDGELKRLTAGNGRTLVATLSCDDLVLDIQMYFTPDVAPNEPFVTPYMKTTAQSFIDSVKADCSGR
jgi:hypothetical protein